MRKKHLFVAMVVDTQPTRMWPAVGECGRYGSPVAIFGCSTRDRLARRSPMTAPEQGSQRRAPTPTSNTIVASTAPNRNTHCFPVYVAPRHLAGLEWQPLGRDPSRSN